MTTTRDHERPSATEHESSAEHRGLAFADWAAELRGDELANITFSGVLLLRAFRVVVRDQDWRTVPPQRTRLSVHEGKSDGQQLIVQLQVRHQDRDVDYDWAGEIIFGATDLTFEMDGTANSTFLRNRIGIVVLHPLSDAGRLIGVTSPDGQFSEQYLPTRISPHQPLRNIRSIQWSNSGLDARLQLSGDVFETEDQRNWTDASFKTYSTPLSEPFPVTVSAGQRIQQTAKLTVRPLTTGPGRRERAVPLGPITLGGPTGQLPAVSPCCSTDNPDLPTRQPNQADDGSTPSPAALLVELDLRTAQWRTTLQSALAEGGHWRAPLDVRLISDEPERIPEAVGDLVGAPVLRLGVFDSATHVTERTLWDYLVYESYRLPGAALVGGSRAHFAELNRCIARLPKDLPELTFSITPQMHACEREHIVDSLCGQRIVAQNAVRLAAARPVHIGPITLKPRFNAVATSHDNAVVAEYPTTPDDRTDDRQGTAFAAAWMLASVRALSIDGVTSLTYFETTGPRGLERDWDGPRYPVHRVAGWLTALAGSTVLEVKGEVPQGVHLLACNSPIGSVVLLCNLGNDCRTIEVVLPFEVADTARLDQHGGTEPLERHSWDTDGSTVSVEIRPDDVILLADCRADQLTRQADQPTLIGTRLSKEVPAPPGQ